MCGLTGIFSSETCKDITEYISKMNSLLVHRGPDDEGIWVKDNIALGHRRLAILDLSKNGAQPMISNCERFILVFNGEIYNHLDLRHELERDNVFINWRGYSDTETLLEAIAHWGIDKALRLSNGMFALALWDQAKKQLSLARDRIGEKPLYWGWAGKDLIFGSELKALRAHPNYTNKICKEALNLYLRFTYVPAPHSIHASVYKLEPGTILSVNSSPPISAPKDPIRPGGFHGSIKIRRYWNLNEEIENGSKNRITDKQEAIEIIETSLKKAIKRQMISDVPLGAFLSGGIDSSTIVALMQKQINRPVKTFTIGFNESNYDESAHAAAVAKYLGTDHTKLNVTDLDAQKVIPDLPRLYDEPFADSSQIPTHLICRAAVKKVVVSLSGDGGDELFGGYNRYLHGPKLGKLISSLSPSMRKILGSTIQKIPISVLNKFEMIYNKVRPGSAGISELDNKIQLLGERLSNIKNIDELYFNMVSNWLNPRQLLVEESIEPNSQLDDKFPDFGIDNPAIKMMFQDIRTYLPDDILCKLDRAAMGVSLETRTPFLDLDVIKSSFRLSANMKIFNGKGKWALRQVLYKHVPQHIIDRPKMGFALPLGLWFHGPLKDWVKDLLSYDNLVQDGLFNANIIEQTLTEHLSGQKDWSKRLWSILMFQAWNNEQK